MKMSWTTIAVLLLVAATANLAAAAPAEDFVEDEIFGGGSKMNFPTDFVFTPSGRELIVVQKKGFVTVWHDTSGDYSFSSKRTLALDISSTVCENGERGLGGVQIHPDFGNTNRYIYLYYAYDPTAACLQDAVDGPVNRFSRLVLKEDWTIDRASERVLFQTPPLAKRIHNGGKIEFGKDGYLYVSTGDSGEASESQSVSNLLGGMIRLTDEGEIPPDNPFAQDPDGVRCNVTGRAGGNNKCQELYAIGLRNPWRFAMNPNTVGNKVQYYINDVGGSEWEEISDGGDDVATSSNIGGITNYAWPIREGPCKRGRQTDCNDYAGDYTHPIHYFPHSDNGGAATGGAFVPDGIGWPTQFKSGYLYADFVSGYIYLLEDDNSRQDCLVTCNPAQSNRQVSVFMQGISIPTLRFGPYVGGNHMALYYTTTANGGSMRRVRYAGGDTFLIKELEDRPQEPPTAVIQYGEKNATATPLLFYLPKIGSVVFSGAASHDSNGNHDMLLYEWDFDGDGVVDSRLAQDSFTFSETGLVYRTTLTVSDENGESDTASVTVVVGTPQQTAGYPSPVFPWKSGADACPVGYDFCGVLEFCQGDGDNEHLFGYRLPCLNDDDGDCECRGIAGPLIRLVPGNKYRITLRNVASEATNLHTHGLHIVGSGDSDDVIRTVSGRGAYCLDYTWDIAADHPGGTYWYHAHHHGSTERQVGGGAYGMLIVEDNTNDELNSTVPLWARNELLLQVVKTADGGVTGNGRTNELMILDASQWYRLRVSFVSVDAEPLNFTFADNGGDDGCVVHKVATDGVWRSAVPGPAARVFEMTGASRADFAVRCSHPGSMIPIYYGEGLVAVLFTGSVEPSPHVMEEWVPVRPYSLQDLSNVVVPEANKLTVHLGYDYVNDLQWDPDVAMATIGYDQVHEWTLRGTDEHPFHIHLYHMQVVTPGGCGAHEEGEFYDVIAAPNECRVRFRTADIGQRCVLHCHVLFHEDNGSMGWVNVTGPGMPRNDVRSFEYSCPADSHTTIQVNPQPTNQTDPQPTNQLTPVKPIPCIPSPILTQASVIKTGEHLASPQLDRFLVQQDDGNLVLIRGTVDNPGEVLWESGMKGSQGEYYTKLQKDGNFVTRPGLPSVVKSGVWSTGARSNDINDGQDYFLAFNCDGTSISIYKGTPDNFAGEVWNSGGKTF